MDIENMETPDIFAYPAESARREMLLSLCEDHIDETECDEEMAAFITHVLKHREPVRLLVCEALGVTTCGSG